MLFDLHPVLLALAGDRMFTGVVRHASHLGGLAFGFLYWRSGGRLEPVLDRFPTARPGRKPMAFRELVIRQFVPRDGGLTERIDEILKKISEQGTGSLTEAERDWRCSRPPQSIAARSRADLIAAAGRRSI